MNENEKLETLNQGKLLTKNWFKSLKIATTRKGMD